MPSSLPLDHPRPAQQTFVGATISEPPSPVPHSPIFAATPDNCAVLLPFMVMLGCPSNSSARVFRHDDVIIVCRSLTGPARSLSL